MQPPTEPTTTATLHGDEDQLYRRHHRDLKRGVARVVNAAPELIEYACQNAWAILLRSQPERAAIFAWLRVAYRLCRAECCHAHLEDLGPGVRWEAAIEDACSIDDTIEAREALRALARLPGR